MSATFDGVALGTALADGSYDPGRVDPLAVINF